MRDAILSEPDTRRDPVSIGNELEEFSKEAGIPNLRDRIQRGLGPMGLFAIQETREKVESLCANLDASYDDLLKMTVAIHRGGPWDYALALKEARDPTTKIWMMLDAVSTIGKEREMDMTKEEFLLDVDRIHALLDEAIEKSDDFFVKAKQHVLEKSQKRFRLEEDIPISEMDNGFIAMAVNGYEAGIVQDADGTLFVGAKEIPEDVFIALKLRAEFGVDERKKPVTFYRNENGETLAKRLHPGFIVIESRNFSLAKAIVKLTLATSEQRRTMQLDSFGHTVYTITSAQTEERSSAPSLQRLLSRPEKNLPKQNDKERNLPASELLLRFYQALADIKLTVQYYDLIKATDEDRKKKGKTTPMTHQERVKFAKKQTAKAEQKIEELQYMMSFIEPELRRLPEETKHVIDMAGGAGDLGLAVTMTMLAERIPIKKTTIVEPEKDLAFFGQLITQRLPLRHEFQRIVHHESMKLQDVNITPDAIVVAKHPCGDLADMIITKWKESESPLLVIMTCCQGKAKEKPSPYDIAQEDWKKLCEESEKTKETDPVKRAQGMEAMTKIDEARVRYLQRYGFVVSLHQTDKFPKGDVIVARRR